MPELGGGAGRSTLCVAPPDVGCFIVPRGGAFVVGVTSMLRFLAPVWLQPRAPALVASAD